MSQDRPPEPSESPTPAPQPETRQVKPSLLKAQTIKFLRALIGILETTVEKLEEPPTVSDVPKQPSLFSWWDWILTRVRALLPASVNQKLSDLGLTSIITAVVAVVLWSAIALIPGKPPEVAQVPPTPTPPTEVAPPTQPEPPPVVETPSPQPETPPTEVVKLPPEVVKPSPKPKPEPKITTPPELTAPQPPVPVKIAPPPAPILTPEQRLIATIQNQVAEITESYAGGLIQSLQADFPNSLLVVTVSPQWYELAAQRQNQLANDMLKQAQSLDFARLEITDERGSLVARSPVIGSNMIILKRQEFAAS